MKGDIKQRYNKRKNEIKLRLDEFSKVSGDNVFYELCFCLLTPQSNAYKCDEAVCILKNKNFLKNEFDTKEILREKTRFYRNKSRYLKEMREKYPELYKEMTKLKTRFERREFLVKHVKGLGYKEASHFLRNIGQRNLAILDRHILKNLERYGAIDEVPKTLTPKKYLEVEKSFLKFSKKIGIPMDELDLLFWSMQTGKVFK
jgi:N-glycosylase/DNA lyase